MRFQQRLNQPLACRPAALAVRLALVGAVFLSANVFAQHDPGRNAVRLLGKGKIEAAVKLLGKAGPETSSPISDAERHYVLTMVACQQGDLAAALEHAQRAVALGLPVERFQAGPRDVFAPL